ncbi:MAG: tetratricopeptide repeat protein [Massilia sp.]|uniref:tetratricopeptide repeat protein n=1 Tax=Massilia sp. TaxID=1882437 RepID=UPI002FC95E0B
MRARQRCFALLWALSGWALAAGATTAQVGAPPAPSAPAAAQEPASQDVLYQDALRALAEGRADEAAALLVRFLDQEPRHAGAWLDLAISQCELGNATEAERLFTEIETQFAPPPGIMEVIAARRAAGCKAATAAARPGAWLAMLGRGHDDNVNQGSNNPFYTIGSGANQVSFELAPAFRPQADNYSQLGLSYVRPLPGRSTLAFQLGARRHDSQRQQDIATGLVALEHAWKPGNWRLRGTVALGAVTLDRALYQRQRQVQGRVTPPLRLPAPLELTFTASASHVRYPTRTSYDGTTTELGSVLAYRSGAALTQFSASVLDDHGQAARPGGDRSGWFTSLQWYTRLGRQWNAEVALTHQSWRSSSVYSPGLIDQVRRQDTTGARLALQWQFRPRTSLVTEWRAARNRENISLFRYNSNAVQLSLRWDHD